MIKASKSLRPPIPIWQRHQQQQKAVHWAERLTASAQGLTVNSCAWCTHTRTHRLAHMCKGEERESAKESQESHLRAYVPWVSRAVKSIVYPYYTGHWLPLCFGLIRRSGTRMCLCVCVFMGHHCYCLCLTVSGYPCLPVTRPVATCSILMIFSKYRMYISLRISVYIELSVNEDDWSATWVVFNLLQSVA